MFKKAIILLVILRFLWNACHHLTLMALMPVQVVFSVPILPNMRYPVCTFPTHTVLKELTMKVNYFVEGTTNFAR